MVVKKITIISWRQSMVKNVYIFILILSFSISCAKNEDEQVSAENAIADSVEAAITSIAGASDEQANETIASLQQPKWYKTWELLNPISLSYAAICSGRAFSQSCISGVKTKSYQDCTIGTSSFRLNGDVSLSYSDSANCDLDTTGESVTRNYDTTRTTAWGAQLRTYSDNHTDFENNTYGGGGKLTRTDNGYELEILGKHKSRTSARGRSSLDISIRTTSPISMDQLARHNRTVNGGAIVIAHNLAQYKVTLEPSNLSYISSCCYPVSGTLNVTYTGSISGSGTVTFSSCGQATVSRGADSYNIEFYSCE